MCTSPLPSAQERGQRWLQAKVQQLLAESAVPPAPPSAEGEPACSWGTGPETGTTLSLRLAGEPEPKALRFRRTMMTDCGTGLMLRSIRPPCGCAGR